MFQYPLLQKETKEVTFSAEGEREERGREGEREREIKLGRLISDAHLQFKYVQF
jgi:hypothetical protein